MNTLLEQMLWDVVSQNSIDRVVDIDIDFWTETKQRDAEQLELIEEE